MDMHTDREINLLFIEDTQRDFRLVELELEKRGLKASLRQAANAAEIAAALEEGGWDLVLADFKVPGVRWENNLATIRARDPEVPVILVSGTVGEEAAVEMLKQGISDFVLKANLTRLGPAIERSLKEAELRRDKAAAEAALKLSEERFRLAQRGTGDGLWDWEPWTHTVYLSPRWKAILGYTDEELESSYESWFSLLHPDDPTPWILQISQLMAFKGNQLEMQYRLRHKSGRYVEILCRCWVVRGEDGLPLRVVGTHEDVTARNEEMQTLRALLEAVPEAILIVNAASEIMMANGTCGRMFGHQGKELLGQPVEKLLPERYRAIHVTDRSHFWSDPSTRAMGDGQELWGQRSDGSEFPIEASLSPINLPQGPAVCVTIRDATDHRHVTETLQRYNLELEAAKARLEEEIRVRHQIEAQLRQHSAELEEFSFIASHDLQTPLRTVHSFANLLSRDFHGQLGPKADEFIAFIVDGSRRMSETLKEVVRFSRVRAAYSPPEAPIDSNMILEAALSRLHTELMASGGEVSHDALPRIMADPEQLGILFENLVSNGLNFRRKEVPPRVRITAEDQGNEWVFCVRDNGIGIAPEYQERIFRVFQRLHSRHAYPGTGMGLALCKRIVEQHGGRIWVESAKGEGAAFFFALPKQIHVEAGVATNNIRGEPTAPEIPSETPTHEESLPADLIQAKIVIADDRPAERDYLKTVLGYAGHTVLTAEDGVQALELVRQEHPDLIISDIMMPRMDGYAFMEELRADSEISATPVIFCSVTYRHPEARLLATASGAARHLVKPVDPVILLDTVQDVLSAAAPPPAVKLPPAEVERAYLRLLNDKLLRKTDELEDEVAARARAEADFRRQIAELEQHVKDYATQLAATKPNAAQVSPQGSSQAAGRRTEQWVVRGPDRRHQAVQGDRSAAPDRASVQWVARGPERRKTAVSRH